MYFSIYKEILYEISTFSEIECLHNTCFIIFVCILNIIRISETLYQPNCIYVT